MFSHVIQLFSQSLLVYLSLLNIHWTHSRTSFSWFPFVVALSTHIQFHSSIFFDSAHPPLLLPPYLSHKPAHTASPFIPSHSYIHSTSTLRCSWRILLPLSFSCHLCCFISSLKFFFLLLLLPCLASFSLIDFLLRFLKFFPQLNCPLASSPWAS